MPIKWGANQFALNNEKKVQKRVLHMGTASMIIKSFFQRQNFTAEHCNEFRFKEAPENRVKEADRTL
jgi:hypothetical protein